MHLPSTSPTSEAKSQGAKTLFQSTASVQKPPTPPHAATGVTRSIASDVDAIADAINCAGDHGVLDHRDPIDQPNQDMMPNIFKLSLNGHRTNLQTKKHKKVPLNVPSLNNPKVRQLGLCHPTCQRQPKPDIASLLPMELENPRWEHLPEISDPEEKLDLLDLDSIAKKAIRASVKGLAIRSYTGLAYSTTVARPPHRQT
ncbi:hypothetical protein BGZ61DRAFT_481380 [Ilyonectria robusta]|uniref:uncharacterized protein n=1 Tax=Ilyonectria robusta TaxID=1079257 RepID=UPI001E8D775C|nr:uncharacterized protein BGZ61DRAFT_481380 [Ilyonectria robusta]KAH8679331.1 hypothetical protein BGZ61DRAFT_481380 [Ilyonectria robusta]